MADLEVPQQRPTTKWNTTNSTSTITIVFVVLLVLSVFHIIVFQSGTVSITSLLSFLGEDRLLSYHDNNGTAGLLKTTTKNHWERNQQCLLLMKKYSGDPFWETVMDEGRDEKDRNVEFFPHDGNDPIIMMKNETQAVDGLKNNIRHDVAFCTIAKNGCSRWRPFLRRVMGYEDNYLTFYAHSDDNGLNYSIDFAPDIFHRTSTRSVEEALIMNTTTSNDKNDEGSSTTGRILLRIAMVRDPLARALSAWTEKVKTNKILPFQCPKHLNMIDKFEDYITCMYDKMTIPKNKRKTKRWSPASPCDWNNHFKPQSCHCHLTKMKYDMLLPVEHVQEWIDPLLSCLGWEQFAFNYTVDKDGQPLSFLEAETTTNPKLKPMLISPVTNSNKLSKLCSMYNQTITSTSDDDNSTTTTVYDMAREIYRSDLLFSTWTMSDCYN